MFQLGYVNDVLLTDEKSNTNALFYYQKAAEQNHVLAQFNLGQLYRMDKKKVEANQEKATYWYGKAAQQGYAEAAYSLGLQHYYGAGTPKNYSIVKSIYF